MSISVKNLKVTRFGEKLRQLRQLHAMTHAELAVMVGYASSSHISLLENGHKNPTVDLVLKVSKLFGVSADSLIDDEISITPSR